MKDILRKSNSGTFWLLLSQNFLRKIGQISQKMQEFQRKFIYAPNDQNIFEIMKKS